MGSERLAAANLAAGTLLAGGYVALVDPSRPGHYPTCPTKLLTGFDCPACGTLRGLHELSRGHVVAALEHNVLLLAAVPLGLWVWCRWVRTAATGAVPKPRSWPRWAVPAAVALAVVFTLARNLPIDALTWLDAA